MSNIRLPGAFCQFWWGIMLQRKHHYTCKFSEWLGQRLNDSLADINPNSILKPHYHLIPGGNAQCLVLRWKRSPKFLRVQGYHFEVGWSKNHLLHYSINWQTETSYESYSVIHNSAKTSLQITDFYTYSFSHGLAVNMSCCCLLSNLYISSALLTDSILLANDQLFWAFCASILVETRSNWVRNC